MAKAILEFNLPEDAEQFMLAVKSWDMMQVISELDEDLRVQTKYAPDTMSQEVYDTLNQTRNKLRELMANYDVAINLLK